MRLGWRWAALKNGLMDEAAYRTEFFIQILSSAAVPAAVQIVLWYALFKVGGNTEVAGWGYQELIHYTLVSTLFTQIRGGDHDFELQEMIRTGGLSNYLLRPASVIQFVYLRGVGAKLLIASMGLVLGSLVLAWLGMAPTRMPGAMLLAVLGNIIHYQISAALATTAFLWEEAYSVLMVKNMIVALLSGETIPLNMFPESLQWLWKATPFYLFVFGPTQYALGNWSNDEFFYQLGVAGIWIVAGWLMIRVSWGFGMKRYLSLGG